MGEANVALNDYMKNSDRIRSVLEYYLGEKLPEDWVWEEVGGFYPARNSRGRLTYRQRDFVGNVCVGGTHFLLGLENQDKINLIFPWRLMEMDCLAYGQELESIHEKNRHTRQNYGKEDDFLYRYGKDDRVRPILNLTLYWGKENWDTPLSLREMMGDISKLPLKLQQLSGDYTVHLIHMRQIPEEALRKMESDLKYVLGLMRRAASSKEYKAYILDNKNFFSRIPKSALNVIDVCTNIKDIKAHLEFHINGESGEEEADMCKALEDIKEDAKKQGMKQGVKQGIQRMNRLVQQLLADGRQEDLIRATTDEVFRKRLLKEYHI